MNMLPLGCNWGGWNFYWSADEQRRSRIAASIYRVLCWFFDFLWIGDNQTVIATPAAEFTEQIGAHLIALQTLN